MKTAKTVITTEGIKCQVNGVISGKECAKLQKTCKCSTCFIYTLSVKGSKN